MINKQDKTQPGRRKEQRSSDSTEENGNHTEETQHGPSQSPPNIRGEFRPRQTRQLPRAVDLKVRLLSCQSY